MEATIERTAIPEHGSAALSDCQMDGSFEQDDETDFLSLREPHDSFECSSGGRGEIVEIMVLHRALRMMQFAGGAKLRVSYR